jgi:pentalenene oxygenase
MPTSPLSARSFFRDPVGFAAAHPSGGRGLSLRAGRQRFVVVRSPADAWSVLVTDAARYAPGKWKRRARRFVGDTLNTLHGSEHRERRLLLAPALARDRVAGFAGLIPPLVLDATADWAPGRRIDVRAVFDPLSLAIACRFLLGVELRDADALARQLAEVMTGLPQRRPPAAAVRARAAALERIGALVRERRAAGRGNDDLLDCLLASGLPDATIHGEVLAFLLAAADEPPSALAALVHLLGRDPGRQARLRAELDDVLGGRLPALADEARLPYAAAVVREALRLYPPARHVDRCPLARVELGGLDVPPEANVLVSPLVLHRLEGVWEEPHAFRPERWLTAARPPRGAYLPFGAGPHTCIGEPLAHAIVFLTLTTLASRWAFAVDGAATPEPRQPRLVATLAARTPPG